MPKLLTRFLTVGDLRALIANLPDNALLGTAVNEQWCGPNLTAERWRLVQHKQSKRVGLIIGDESLSRTVDTNEAFYEAYTVLMGDPSFDVRNTDPNFRKLQNDPGPDFSLF
jgi:hypothetical protein